MSSVLFYTYSIEVRLGHQVIRREREVKLELRREGRPREEDLSVPHINGMVDSKMNEPQK